jgi:hypothetical protein
MKRYQQKMTMVRPLPPNQEVINTRIQSIEQRHMPELPPKPRLVIVEKEWERPVTAAGRPQFIVGFLDLSVKYRRPQIRFHTEYEAAQAKRDLCYVGEVSGAILFEVKGRIDSLGALLRQLAKFCRKFSASVW